MSRCICCQNILKPGELVKKKPDGSPEDMCTRCIKKALYPQYEPDKTLAILTEVDVLSLKSFTTYRE